MIKNKDKTNYVMSRIKGKDTSIEKAVRSELFKRGIRFRANSNSIYGHPDISLKKYKIAIFCDGDFWHGYDWEEQSKRIKSNRSYWIPKIERNMEKDIEVNHVLSYLGYKVIRVWEHEIRKDLMGVCDMLEDEIVSAKQETEMRIRKARITDKDLVYTFYDNVIDSMAQSPFSPGWEKGIYPTQEELLQSILERCLYIMTFKGEIIGAFVMDSKQTEGYQDAPWTIAEPEKVLILHKLAVKHELQNRGLAKRLVDHAIKTARKMKKAAIRLDVYKPNIPASRLYLSKGFKHIASRKLFYEDTGIADFELYELLL